MTWNGIPIKTYHPGYKMWAAGLDDDEGRAVDGDSEDIATANLIQELWEQGR